MVSFQKNLWKVLKDWRWLLNNPEKISHQKMFRSCTLTELIIQWFSYECTREFHCFEISTVSIGRSVLLAPRLWNFPGLKLSIDKKSTDSKRNNCQSLENVLYIILKYVCIYILIEINNSNQTKSFSKAIANWRI